MTLKKEKRYKKKVVRSNRSKKTSFKILAEKRMGELFIRASSLFKISPIYSNNCVALARKISLRYKVPFSKEQKILFCKGCGSYLFPSRTARLRVSRGKVVVLCNNCKAISRYVYK